MKAFVKWAWIILALVLFAGFWPLVALAAYAIAMLVSARLRGNR